MTKNLFASIAIFVLTFATYGQISVTNTQTPSQLVQNVLLGFGVTATNITINGSAANANVVNGAVTYFDAIGTAFPIPTGVLLTTGNGIAAIGPNTSGSYTNNNPATANVSGDPHLNAIANAGVTNGVVLEFDFVPSGDTISFNYIFGSDEYPEYSPSSFNDAFGFFLWGPGISGPYALGGYPAGGANLAVIPGTSTPVTINNLGPGAGQYPQYYANNLGGAAYGSAIQYDGTTTVLSSNASVQCGQTYHIKLCISNVGDQSYDSGVFLQANSFSSEAIQIAVATVSGDTSIYEGCTDASLMFIRPQTQLGDTMIITYDIGGTATMGTDYNNLPNPVTFLPGEDTVTITITPFADGFPDNAEYVTITATTISECGDTIISTGTLYILDSIPIPIDESDTTVFCYNDSVMVTAFASGLFPPFTYEWGDGQTGTSAYYPTISGTMQGSIDYYVTATNSCGYTGTDTVTITLNQTLTIDTLIMSPSSSCPPYNGWVSAQVSGVTQVLGQPFYHWSDSIVSVINYEVDGTVMTGLPSGWYYFSVTDDVCFANDSIFVEPLEPPIASFSASPTSGCSPLQVTFTNNSQNTNYYDWDFGGGNVITVNNMNSQTQTFTQSTTVTLTAYEDADCFDDMTISIYISICGCTDPNATNYDPNAEIDDESCFYPVPTVIAPNVFTPNSDLENNYFFLKTTNTVLLEMTILNRWGNEMFYASTDLTTNILGEQLIGWDGRSKGGSDAQEGVYFYKYTATGIDGTTVEGHGFLQLVRD